MIEEDIGKVIEMVNKTIIKSGFDKREDGNIIRIGKDVSVEQWNTFINNKWVKGNND